MTYQEFVQLVQHNMHETIYEDSEGRSILIIDLLDAYAMANKMVAAERERCAELRKELTFFYFDKPSTIGKQELVGLVNQALDDYAKLIRTGDV